MIYLEALERAKSTPVMRPHWKHYWLTWSNGKLCALSDDGSIASWYPFKNELEATDWIEAPKPVDEF